MAFILAVRPAKCCIQEMNDIENQEFTAILIEDVVRSIHQNNQNDCQSTRRDLVRTSFAAIEGCAWALRETVIDAANETYGLTEDENFAFAEAIYSVNDQGKISKQQRFLSLKASIRLSAEIAKRISGEVCIDFSKNEWSKFGDSIAIRNRITHPKNHQDMHLEREEVNQIVSALFWLLEEISDAMKNTIQTRRKYLGEFKHVLSKLKSGDPEMVALYEYLKEQPSEN